MQVAQILWIFTYNLCKARHPKPHFFFVINLLLNIKEFPFNIAARTKVSGIGERSPSNPDIPY